MKSTLIQEINDNGLAKFLPQVNMTERDKEIVSRYIEKQESYIVLGEAYDISGERVRQIIVKFIRKAQYYSRKEHKND